ncbi:MAG: DUF4340 domain-containing protein, partial [Ignavibacteria bacterium]|nr:DUF4340 domain-containing protein [Ignavibacteria bacterium]
STAPGSGNAATAVGAKFADTLAARVNDVAEITVQAAGKETSIKRDGTRWVVPARGNYPADPDKVRDAVLSVAEMTVSEIKTQKPENYSFLGVQDPSVADSPARLVTFKDAQGTVISSLVVGNTSASPGASRGGAAIGVFVRRAGDAQAYETRTRLDPRGSLDPEPGNWIKKQIDGVSADRVRNILITHADGGTVEIGKGNKDDRDYTLANIPAGRELKYAGAAAAVAQSVAMITFDDVKPIAEVAQGASPTGTAVFRTFDGLVLTIDTSTKDGTSWATFNARYDAPAEAAAPTEPTPSDQPPPAAPKPRSGDEVRKEVETLNARFSGWAYALPQYRITQLLSKMDDLLKPVEAPAPTEEGSLAPLQGDGGAPPSVPDK